MQKTTSQFASRKAMGIYMWKCPICKKDNIDNAHLCLHCMSGKLCTHCKSVYTGDVCSNCGKDSGKKMWLTESEYSSYISELATAAGVSSEKAETDNVDSDNQVTDNSESLQNEEIISDVPDTSDEVNDAVDDTVACNVEESISTDNDVHADDACETPVQPESAKEETVNPEPVEPVAEKIVKPPFVNLRGSFLQK